MVPVNGAKAVRGYEYVMAAAFFATTVATLVGPWIYFEAAPRVHGMIAPVVTPIEIHKIASTADGGSVIEAEAEKLRDCSYRGVEWFLGPPGANVPVVAAFTDPPQVRRPGFLYWEGLSVGIPPAQVTGLSRGYVLHECGYPWLVRSLFYDAAR